jgi:transposase
VTTTTPEAKRTRRRRVGRPPSWSRRKDRDRHLKAWAMLEVQRLSAPEVARVFGVSVATVYRWVSLARDYDEPLAEGLRRREAERG